MLALLKLGPTFRFNNTLNNPYPNLHQHITPSTPIPTLSLLKFGRNDSGPKQLTAETTHGRNDSRPKWPTFLGRNDPPQKLAKTTQAETTRILR